MDKKRAETIFYYTTATVFATAICWIIIASLQWPLLAEISLAVSIFVQILSIAKALAKFWAGYKMYFMEKKSNNIRPLIHFILNPDTLSAIKSESRDQ